MYASSTVHETSLSCALHIFMVYCMDCLPDCQCNANPCARTEACAGAQIAITFDDLPFVHEGLSITDIQKKTRALLKTLQKHRVKAIGFVNEDKLYIKQSEVNARIGILEAWLDAGMGLGTDELGHLG